MNTIDWLHRFAETRTLNNLFLVFEHLPTATAEMCRFVWNSSNNDNISSLLVCKNTTKQQVKLGRHLQIWLHLTAGFSLLMNSFLKNLAKVAIIPIFERLSEVQKFPFKEYRISEIAGSNTFSAIGSFDSVKWVYAMMICLLFCYCHYCHLL